MTGGGGTKRPPKPRPPPGPSSGSGSKLVTRHGGSGSSGSGSSGSGSGSSSSGSSGSKTSRLAAGAGADILKRDKELSMLGVSTPSRPDHATPSPSLHRGYAADSAPVCATRRHRRAQPEATALHALGAAVRPPRGPHPRRRGGLAANCRSSSLALHEGSSGRLFHDCGHRRMATSLAAGFSRPVALCSYVCGV